MKASEFNQLSPSYARKLKTGERAVYRVLNIKEDPDNYGKYIIPAAVQIPSTDVIYDNHKEDYITIGCIERVKSDGDPVLAPIVFTGQNMGYIFLNGNNALHQKMYQFLEICNFNASNPERNQEIDAIFVRIDAKADAKNERNVRRQIIDAVNLALSLDDEKAKEIANALGIEAASIEEIRNKLEDYASDEPQEFTKVAERASLGTESLLREAVKQGFIRNNINASMFEWAETGKEIFKYKKVANKNYFKELAEYLEASNPNELEAIKTRLG